MTQTATPAKKSLKSVLDSIETPEMQFYRDFLTKAVYKATPGLHTPTPTGTTSAPPVPTADPRIEKLEEIFNGGGWGSDETRNSVKAICEVLVGAPLTMGPRKRKSFKFIKRFMLIVPLTNPNNHCYPIGATCMMAEDDNDYAFFFHPRDGFRSGDHLPMSDKSAFRYASKAEADEFVNKFVKNTKMSLKYVRENFSDPIFPDFPG